MLIQIYVSISITAGLSAICIKTIALKYEYFHNEKLQMTQIGCVKGDRERGEFPLSTASINPFLQHNQRTQAGLWNLQLDGFSKRVKQTDSTLSVGQLQQFKDNAELIFYCFCNRLPQIGWKLEAESTKVEQRRSLFARVEI